MADKEFTNRDSDTGWWGNNLRLTKDPEIKAEGKIVRLTFVSTSSNKGNNGVIDLWVEVVPDQYSTEPAKYLKKDDEISRVEGHEEMRQFGDNNERRAFGVKFAKLKFSSALKAELKKRGWDPSKKTEGAAPAVKKTTTTTTRTQRRAVQTLPE